jgi:hypothetical protein
VVITAGRTGRKHPAARFVDSGKKVCPEHPRSGALRSRIDGDIRVALIIQVPLENFRIRTRILLPRIEEGIVSKAVETGSLGDKAYTHIRPITRGRSPVEPLAKEPQDGPAPKGLPFFELREVQFDFKRLGMTVSIFRLFWKLLSPTNTRAVQLPVGAWVAVGTLK